MNNIKVENKQQGDDLATIITLFNGEIVADNIAFYLLNNDEIRVIKSNCFFSAMEHFNYYDLGIEINNNANINIFAKTKNGIMRINNLSIENLNLIYSNLLELANLNENKHFNSKEFKKFIAEELKQIEMLSNKII